MGGGVRVVIGRGAGGGGLNTSSWG
jgi:hypothetical protein